VKHRERQRGGVEVGETMGAAGEEGAGSPVAASKGGGKGSGKTATATTASSSPPAASGTAALTTPAAAAATVVADGQPAAPPGSYSEWAAAFQAYYAAGGGQPPPPGAFAPHPYMWGGQPIMPPPYGAPPPYGGMFPPAAGMYGHPGMYGQYGAPPPLPVPPVASEVAKEHAEHPKQESVEGGAKSQTSKQSTLKRTKGSKGSSLMTTTTLKRKGSDGGKENGAGGFAPSSNGDENESGSDASTDASEDESPQNLTHNKRSFDQLALNASGVGGGGGSYVSPPPPVGQSHPDTTPALGTPGTGAGSLEMSLDYWNTGSASLVKASKQMSASPSTSAPPTELWLQDERELKRQRRKQSNRESARRSRLRKQAECEELGTRVDSLNVENVALRTELSRMTEECKRLQAENAALHGQLCNIPQQVTVRASESEDVPVANDEGDEDSQPKENGNSKRKQDNPAGETSVLGT
jgi:plant G-box-binding factor